MKIEAILRNGIAAAMQELYGAVIDNKMINFQKTKKEFSGDITLVVFPFLKISGKGPGLTGDDIGKYLKKNLDEIHSYNVINGFLNLIIDDSFWKEHFNHFYGQENYGFQEAFNGKNTMVEFSSPNTNKPLHMGHIRNNLLGYAVSKILSANGHRVIKAQIINDRGIHICKSMLAWEKWGNGETPESSGMKGDKLVGKYYVLFDKKFRQEVSDIAAAYGIPEDEAARDVPLMKEAQEMLRKWEDRDEQVFSLWKKMNSWVYKGFDETYKALGVDFDKLYYESETYLLGKEEVLKGVEKGVFYQKGDGSVWCDLSEEGLDHKLLLRGDGTSVYMTQDIGTAVLRFKEFPDLDQLIYTVGNEQDYHFKVLFLILKKLGYEWAEHCYHLSYGMVDLPSGKMKSREGTVVDADDLILEMEETAKNTAEELGKVEEMPEEEKKYLYRIIGLAALKYFILKVDAKKRMLFDPVESVDFNGNTGPFIQYTYARIQSVLRKSGSKGLTGINEEVELNENERNLMKWIYDYPSVVNEAGENYNPAGIANYTYELVKEYNYFYQNVPILRAENEEVLQLRLALSDMTARVIKSGMDLLGIEMPERM